MSNPLNRTITVHKSEFKALELGREGSGDFHFKVIEDDGNHVTLFMTELNIDAGNKADKSLEEMTKNKNGDQDSEMKDDPDTADI